MLLENLGKHALAASREDTKSTAVRKVRENHEDHLSAALNYWLDLPEVELRGAGFHVPNERASRAEAGRLRWVGVKPGVGDWIFAGPPATAIELKWGKNVQSPAQKQWAAKFVDGWTGYLDLEEPDAKKRTVIESFFEDSFAPRYYVCRTLTNAVDVLHTRGLLRAPLSREDLDKSVAVVLRWWLAKYRKELEP